MAAGRVFWTEEECNLLISVVEEKNILKLIDGKKYRRKEIFKIVKNEFERRGIVDKNESQLENKWKNLKKAYIAAKKINDRSGAGRATCDYYDMLDRILGSRPSSSLIPNYVDTSRVHLPDMKNCQDNIVLDECEVISENNEGGMPENEEIVLQSEETMSGNNRNKRKRKGNHAADVANEFNKICENMQNKFFTQQKELINYEVELFEQMRKKNTESFHEETRKILEESNRSFLNDLKNLLSSEVQRNRGSTSFCTCDKENTSNVEHELGEFLQFKD